MRARGGLEPLDARRDDIMMMELRILSALGAFALVFGLACGKSGISTTQKPDGQVTTCFFGANILVGNPCPSPATSSCQPIPPGIQRLTDDLKSLAAAAVAASECSVL